MTTFLDVVRKGAEERKQRDLVMKGGEGSGWYAPPKGTHTAGAKAGTKLETIIPKANRENGRKIDRLEVKERIRDYFEMRAMARGKRGKRISVRRRLVDYTEDNSAIYQHRSGGEEVFEVQGTTTSMIYFPTKP